MYRMLIRNIRAYDTGSEKIWDSINKGVRIRIATRTCVANLVDSGNGRTSSTGSWSNPRTTSRAAASVYHSSEHNTRRLGWVGGWALYIEVYFTDAEYESTVLTTTIKDRLHAIKTGMIAGSNWKQATRALFSMPYSLSTKIRHVCCFACACAEACI